jgi:hypothetical protein
MDSKNVEKLKQIFSRSNYYDSIGKYKVADLLHLRAIKIAQFNEDEPMSIKSPTAPSDQTSPQQGDSNILNQPGVVTFAPYGPGEKLFNKNLSGKEFSAMFITHTPTAQDISNFIVDTLKNNGYNNEVNYTPEQAKEFSDLVNRALQNKYGMLLQYMNPNLV